MNAYICWLTILLLSLILREHTADGKRKKKKRLPSRPNIIFILMDDLDMQLGSMEVMKKTRKIFQKEGAEFVNAFVTSPICCPSRSSILTGMYAHNHGCMTNTVNCASMTWRRGPEKKNFGYYLQQAGYKTGYFGKYLNNYDGSWIPTGWDNWSALVRNSKFYNYTLIKNKIIERHGNNYKKDYFTDVVTDYSINFFRQSRFNEPYKPVMMVLSMAAPHGPEDPAPQHQHLFKNITAPRDPNFNVHSTDKHWLLQYTKPMDAQKIAFSDLLHRRRLLTLLSVDDAIHRLYRKLKSQGMLDNTYIFFSSDHGYHLGQFGLAKGKSMPYETDIRVPFYALGPKIPKRTRVKDIVLNIDLAPTFVDLASMKVPRAMDGRSIMELLESYREKKSDLNWRETFLVEKTKKFYASKHEVQSKTKAELIRKKCHLLSYPSPCTSGQQWTCAMHNGQLRLRKCRRATDNSKEHVRVPRSLNKKHCRCFKKDRGRSNQRRYKKRDLDNIPRGYYRWYYKSARARKEFKKLENYEHHLKKESSAKYNKKVFGKTIQKRLKKLDSRIQASRKRLSTLRSLKKTIVKLIYKPQTDEKWCRCENGFEVEEVTFGGDRKVIKTHPSKGKSGKRQNKGKKKKNRCAARGLNCFEHTNSHWKTAPLWTNGNFCFCPTSSNNTYWCLRTINSQHNFLYCEFVTSFCEFFDLNKDPYQLTNKIDTLPKGFHERLHQQLEFLASCQHSNGCEMYANRKVPQNSIYPLQKACTNRKYSS